MAYEIWIANDRGTRLFECPDFISFEAVKVLGDVGGCKLVLPDDSYREADFGRDFIVLFTYSGASAWAYFVRELGQQPGVLILNGDSSLVPVEDRIVAYPANKAETAKNGSADDVMKAIVRENLGASAIAARDLSEYLSVSPDLGLALSVSKEFAWQVVLTVLRDIQGMALLLNSNVYFDIVPYFSGGQIRFRFDTYLDQPGVDRTSGSTRLVFSESRNNLQNPTVWKIWRQRKTYAYALGQGEGDDREQQEIYAAGVNDSVWSRVETYVDARMSQSADAVRAEARRAIAESAPIVRFEGEAIDTEGSRFGIDWNWGDRVIGEYDRVEYPCLIDTVHVRLMRDEPIVVSAKLLYEGWIS